MAGRVGIYPGQIVAHGQLAVGTAAVQITATATEIDSLAIKNDDDGGTASIYVGKDNTVTTSTGYRLKAGQGLGLDIADLSGVWLIADAASQEASYIATRSVG